MGLWAVAISRLCRRRRLRKPPTPMSKATTSWWRRSVLCGHGKSFLSTHKTGFYADLARAQVASLRSLSRERLFVPACLRARTGNPNVRNNAGRQQCVATAAVPAVGGRNSSNEETLEWNKIKDSIGPRSLEKFIQKYPSAPLSDWAQKRLEMLRQAQREREAAQKAAEDARIQAEQKKAAEAAARQKQEQERLAREAEAAQKAKAAEAERKAAEARQKAEQAERERAAAEAAAARAAAEKQARDAEEARKKAELAARKRHAKPSRAS